MTATNPPMFRFTIRDVLSRGAGDEIDSHKLFPLSVADSGRGVGCGLGRSLPKKRGKRKWRSRPTKRYWGRWD